MNVSVYKDALQRKRAELDAGRGSQAAPAARWSTTTAARATWPTRRPATTKCTSSLRLKQTDAKILQAIDEALVRIEKGTFGICRDCGEPIAEARLNAIPWTRVCITCKEKQKA